MMVRVVPAVSILLVVLGLGDALQAQDYGVLPDSIPDRYSATPLDRLAYEDTPSAIVRLEALRLVVEDPEEATLYVRKVITIYDRDGRHHGRQVLPYDSFVEIENLEGRVLNAKGETIKELEDDHVNDQSGIGGSLYSDARVKIAKLFADGYPYTVEFRYETEISAPMRWPTWYPGYSEAPMEFGQFEVDAPRHLNVRHHVAADSLQRHVRQTEDRRVLRWRAADRPAYEREPWGPSWGEQAPSVHVGPTRFETAGTTGDMSTWSSLGAWYADLKAARDELPSDVASEIRKRVEHASTKRDSVRRLYRHLQKETRYVSVQLGIGGWQPFPASYVRERGYGDCKALTNYMEASLKAIGIRSYPVLINLGFDEPPLLKEFPSNQFNHVVLAVPLERDTLWLENTDTTAPFGHVHAQIEDRHGLMVTQGEGTLVRTPASSAAANRQARTATVDLKPDGTGTASLQTTYTGNQQDRIRRRLVDKPPRERREWVRQLVDVPSFDLKSADFSDVEAYQDTVRLPLELELPRYAAKTGKRLFLPLNLMQRQTDVPPEMDQSRTQPVDAFPYPYTDVDSIRYVLPSGHDVEALPDPVTIETDFATYEATVERKQDVLLYRRRLTWREKTLPPDRYEVVRRFLQKVAEADKAQAVLIQRES